jgi:dTDP-4-dehydrorhamnose reductase
MKKLLVTGASGFLGWHICHRAQPEWKVFGTCHLHPVNFQGVNPVKIDLTKFNDLKMVFKEVKPAVVIHTAAVSKINYCQQNKAASFKINTEAAVNIAGLCSDVQIPCLFTSSDLVFDGQNPPYCEEDEPSPVNIYGEQKVLAESGMKRRYPSVVICRLPLMFGDPGPSASSFIQPMIRAMKSGDRVDLFTDEFRTPLSGKDAAEGLMIALEGLPDKIHLGGPQRISRFEFGKLLAKVLNLPDIGLKPCLQVDLNLPAPRPADVSLDSARAKHLGFQPCSLKDALLQM